MFKKGDRVYDIYCPEWGVGIVGEEFDHLGVEVTFDGDGNDDYAGSVLYNEEYQKHLIHEELYNSPLIRALY